MSKRNDKLEALFEAALALESKEQRLAYLENACPDLDLRREVESLLEAHGDPDSLLASEATEKQGAVLEQPGDQIGRYKLLEKLGEGGFGVVYMAEQREPVKRRVALKIIKVGMDTREVVARFEAERQALAMMDHPNIAKIFDAGSTECPLGLPELPSGESQIVNRKSQIPSGRPYFVMELVRGIKLTDYCDERSVSTRERLELFMQVCQAVQHAHQKGIIHRDLKPSNILVTVNDGVPVPKIIDFGIAKATQMELTEKTVFTRFQQFLGTPAYMSPEQAEISSVDVDTRSDIYSLGVLLYELLTGKTPFDALELLKAGLDEMRRTIREKEPERPSTRVSTLRGDELTTTAKRRGLDAPKLINVLRGDLDWIVMKSLEKDRARRYDTANDLAADIQRHLSNEPIVARPPSRVYQFQKLVQRNKVVFAAGSAVIAALVVGLGVSIWQSVEKGKSYRRAQTEAAKSQRVARFLKEMIRGVKPSVALGRDSTLLREIAEETLKQLAQEKDVPPEVEVELRASIGEVFHAVGELKKAEAMHRETLSRMREILGDEHPQVLDLLLDLACVLEDREKPQESEAIVREALALARKLHGPQHTKVARALLLLANASARQKRTTEAEALMRQALEMGRRVHGPEHLDVAFSQCRLATILDEQGLTDEAEPRFRESLAMMKKLHGDTHPTTAQVLLNFATSKFRHKKWREAEPLYRELLVAQRTLFGNGHRCVAATLTDLAATLVNLGQHAQGEPFAREAVAIYKRERPGDHPEVATALHNLAMSLSGQARLEEAEGVMREAVTMQRKLSRPDSEELMQTLRNLIRILIGEQKLAEAEPFIRERLELARSKAASKPDELRPRLWELGDVLYRQGKMGDAEPLFREALQISRAQPTPDEDDTAADSASLGRLLADWAWTERTNKSELQKSEIGERAHEAERLLRGSLATRLSQTNATPWRTNELKSRLGGALVSVAVTDSKLTATDQQARLAEAEALLLEGNNAVQQGRSADRKYRRDTLERLIRLYVAWEKPTQAGEWREKLRTFDEENRGFEPVP